MIDRAKFLGLFLLLFTASALNADIGGLGFNVTGRWTMRISTPGGRILGFAELRQSGNQITGWLEPDQGDSIPISGALLSGRLILTTHPESRRLVAFDRCEVNADASHMKGTFYPGNGKIEFTRLREPRLPSRRRN